MGPTLSTLPELHDDARYGAARCKEFLAASPSSWAFAVPKQTALGVPRSSTRTNLQRSS